MTEAFDFDQLIAEETPQQAPAVPAPFDFDEVISQPDQTAPVAKEEPAFDFDEIIAEQPEQPREPSVEAERLQARLAPVKQTPEPAEQPEETGFLAGVPRALGAGALDLAGGITRTVTERPEFFGLGPSGPAGIMIGPAQDVGEALARKTLEALGAEAQAKKIGKFSPRALVRRMGKKSSGLISEMAQDLAPVMQDTEGIFGNLAEAVKGNESAENLQDAGKQLGFALARTAPQIALMFATGGAGGSGLIGASSFGNKLQQLEEENPDMDPTLMRINAAGTALAELASERLGTGKQVERILGRNAVKKGIVAGMKEMARGAGVEGFEEGMSQLGENFIDLLTRKKKFDGVRSIFEGVADSGIVGMFSGAGLGAATQIGTGDTVAPPPLPAEIEQADAAVERRAEEGQAAQVEVDRRLEQLSPQERIDTVEALDQIVPPQTPQEVTTKAISNEGRRGSIQQAQLIELEGLPIDRLRQTAKEAGVKASGTKTDIAQRIIDAPQEAPFIPPPPQVDQVTNEEVKPLAKQIGVNERGSVNTVRKRIKNVAQAREVLETSDDFVERFLAATTIHKQVIPETKALRRKERAQRFARAQRIMDTVPGQRGLNLAKKELQGELPTAERTPVAEFFNRAEIDSLINMVGNKKVDLKTGERVTGSNAISRMMNGQALRESEIKILEKVFGQEFSRAARPLYATDKIANFFVESAGLLRTLKTMLDVSAIGRQGALLAPMNIPSVKKALGDMGRGMFSEENYERLHDSILNDPRYAVAEEAGLYIAPTDGAPLNEREESFASEWAKKLPGAQISERAFNGYLNSLRADVFYKFVDKYGDQAGLEDFRKFATWVNEATGRGGFSRESNFGRKVEDAMPLLGTTFFSPRWVLSRIQTPLTTITPVRDAETGKLRWSPANMQAIKNMSAYYGLLLTVLGIAKASGAEVEDDPRSTDFAKVKVGNTRLDLSGGMQQYWRFLSQMITEQRKNLSSGDITPAKREKLLWRFIRSKLAPAPGLILSAMFGKTFTGDEFIPIGDEPTAQALSKYMTDAGFNKGASERVAKTGEIMLRELSPLIIQQTIEGVQNDGLFLGLLGGASEFIGISSSSFQSRPSKSKTRTRRRSRRRSR